MESSGRAESKTVPELAFLVSFEGDIAGFTLTGKGPGGHHCICAQCIRLGFVGIVNMQSVAALLHYSWTAPHTIVTLLKHSLLHTDNSSVII